jgi:endonuclease/exonuclease/phosphatase family metal-dependent hydrolase
MSSDRDALQAESRALRAALGRFRTRSAWLADPEGPSLTARLDRHLSQVRRFVPEVPAASPPRDWLHVVQWNVLHGDLFDAVRAALQEAPALAGADLVALEETDLGMARSGNRDVAFELAAALGLHAAWTPLFLELEGGYRAPAAAASAEQREALFGLALLSRFPLGAVRRIALQTREALIFDHERKAGTFAALVAEVRHPVAPFTAAAMHLDVHAAPDERELQMQTVLEALPAGAAVLAGDLNTTTFARGGMGRAARTLATLALAPRGRLRRRLLEPHRDTAGREPLFARLQRAGFLLEGFNDPTPSLDVRFDDVHELDLLPASLRRLALALLRGVERRNSMRLDWIAARGFVPAPERPPVTLPEMMRGPGAGSDHAPITCGLRFRDRSEPHRSGSVT